VCVLWVCVCVVCVCVMCVCVVCVCVVCVCGVCVSCVCVCVSNCVCCGNNIEAAEDRFGLQFTERNNCIRIITLGLFC